MMMCVIILTYGMLSVIVLSGVMCTIMLDVVMLIAVVPRVYLTL
jgi:hypothetical protein